MFGTFNIFCTVALPAEVFLGNYPCQMVTAILIILHKQMKDFLSSPLNYLTPQPDEHNLCECISKSSHREGKKKKKVLCKQRLWHNVFLKPIIIFYACSPHQVWVLKDFSFNMNLNKFKQAPCKQHDYIHILNFSQPFPTLCSFPVSWIQPLFKERKKSCSLPPSSLITQKLNLINFLLSVSKLLPCNKAQILSTLPS